MSTNSIFDDPITIEQAIQSLNDIKDGDDEEDAHRDADHVLLRYLYTIGEKQLVRAYLAAKGRVNFWYA